MQITEKLMICKIEATRSDSAPFKLTLENNRGEESSLLLDSNTCTRYKIPISLNLTGRTLVCSFESRELPLQNDGHFLFLGQFTKEPPRNDDLEIQSLNKEEIIKPTFMSIPPSKHIEILRTLKLSSFGGEGIHFHTTPCPFYRFILELTEKEYNICKALPEATVFKVNFRFV